jgi:DNA-binding transcriptional LysR family regulator
MSVEFSQIEAFVVLAEELHFGRASQRLLVSQPMVSRRIATLERNVGGVLFERTSRRVGLTPLGADLLGQLRPAYDQLHEALRRARVASGQAAGLLRIGVGATTGSPVLTSVVDAFCAGRHDCEVDVREVDIWDPLGPLYRNETDIILNWHAFDEPDLTIGPTLEYRERVLAVSQGHRLATRQSVSIEELADERVHGGMPAAVYPAAFLEAILPKHTPSGRPVPRDARPAGSLQEILHRVGLGELVHPTMTGISVYARPDITLVPINDLPPMPLGLIWCTARENARIRSFAAFAKSMTERAPRRAGTAVRKVPGSG